MEVLQIPFKRSFKHATAERTVTQTVWVLAESSRGLVGFGEGCPREYVTGESIASALQFFQAVQHEVTAIAGLDELRSWVTRHRAQIDANAAAWCAIELALLDVIAKEGGQTVEALLALPPIMGPFHYTAVLGAEMGTGFEAQLARYRQLGFRDFKIKLSGDRAADQARIARLDSGAPAIRSLRVDANNLWSHAEQAIDYLRPLGRSFFAVEEPLSAGDYAGLGRVAASAGVKIILDESFLRQEQFEALRPLPGPWIINLRVSKMGGLLRSLAIAEQAARLGIPIVVGCQVGETSLLTRAALTVAEAMSGPGLIGQEGAFGTHLLMHDPATPSLVFGAAGRLDVTPHRFRDAPGFGLRCRGAQAWEAG